MQWMVASKWRHRVTGWLLALAVSTLALQSEDDAARVRVVADRSGMIRHEVSSGGATSVRKEADLSQGQAFGNATSNGTIAVFVSAGNLPLLNLKHILVPALLRSIQFETPVTIMFAGNRTLVENAAKALEGHDLLRPVHLEDVSAYFTATQEEVNMLKSADARMREFGMPYRKKCEFWARHVFTLPALANYRYLWRLEVDSDITKPVTENLYDVMRVRGAVFGYMVVAKAAAEACQGFQNATQAFFEADPHFTPISGESQIFLQNFEQRKCPHWDAQFQVMDLDFFRQSRVHQYYTQFLAEILYGFVKYRWGDPLVQTISVLLQVSPLRTLCMRPWAPGFGHAGTEANCNASVSEPVLVPQGRMPTENSFRFWPLWCVLVAILSLGCTALCRGDIYRLVQSTKGRMRN